MRIPLLASLLCLGGCVCGTPPAGEISKVRGATADDGLDTFFGLVIHDIAIELDDEAYDALIDAPRIAVPASLVVDDQPFEQIGLRLKGAAGSFVPLDGDYPEVSGDGNGMPGKSGFILDLDRYQDGQELLGLEKLTLNNLNQDPSGVHEFLGYTLFRAGGVPASRSTWTRVSLNGAPKGLYALIEPPDNDAFLERHYGTSAGSLYEGQYGVDLRADAVYQFDQDHGDDRSRLDLRAVTAALDALGPDDDALPVLEAFFDLDAYLAFATTEIFLGHWDGYAWSANNYSIHYHPEEQRWSFLPWGIDQLFEAELGPFAGVMGEPGPAWVEHGGRMHQLCLASPGCRALLAEAFRSLASRVEEIDLAGQAHDARALVEPVLLEEASAYGDPALTEQRLDQVFVHLAERGDQISSWLPCLEGGRVDHDLDGHDGCTLDCSDHDPYVYPGATERCNFEDDDCNGVLDDPPECPHCVEVSGPDAATFALCHEHLSWPDARQACLDRGQELASLHDPESQEVATWSMLERFHQEAAWIGLNDRDEEGSFAWSDGSALDFAAWTEEAPHHGVDGAEADCVINALWGWIDAPCEEALAYICKSL